MDPKLWLELELELGLTTQYAPRGSSSDSS